MGKNKVGVWVVALAMPFFAMACGGADVAEDGGSSTESSATAAEEDSAAATSSTDEQASATVSGEQQCETITLATLDDPSTHLIFYAINENLVDTRGLQGIDVNFLALPAMIAATATDQFDVVETAMLAVPRILAGGGEVVIIAPTQINLDGAIQVFVRDDGAVESAEQLSGRSLGLQSAGSTGAMALRYVLQERYGLDSALEGGDIDYVELPPDQLLSALSQGQIDAAYLDARVLYEAQETDGLEMLVPVATEFKELTGSYPLLGALTTIPSLAEERGDCLETMRQVIVDSRNYMEANLDEVASAVAADFGADEEYLQYWANNMVEYGGTLESDLRTATENIWEVAEQMGEAPPPPEYESVLLPSAE